MGCNHTKATSHHKNDQAAEYFKARSPLAVDRHRRNCYSAGSSWVPVISKGQRRRITTGNYPRTGISKIPAGSFLPGRAHARRLEASAYCQKHTNPPGGAISPAGRAPWRHRYCGGLSLWPAQQGRHEHFAECWLQTRDLSQRGVTGLERCRVSS